jgi:hypothetical protein
MPQSRIDAPELESPCPPTHYHTGGPTAYGGAVSCGTSKLGGTPGGSGGAVDQWANVTSAAIILDGANNNFRVQDVLADPVRPSDLYAVCFQGVWKSTDFRQKWSQINSGQNGALIDSGKPWGEAIDPNLSRPEYPTHLVQRRVPGWLLDFERWRRELVDDEPAR